MDKKGLADKLPTEYREGGEKRALFNKMAAYKKYLELQVRVRMLEGILEKLRHDLIENEKKDPDNRLTMSAFAELFETKNKTVRSYEEALKLFKKYRIAAELSTDEETVLLSELSSRRNVSLEQINKLEQTGFRMPYIENWREIAKKLFADKRSNDEDENEIDREAEEEERIENIENYLKNNPPLIFDSKEERLIALILQKYKLLGKFLPGENIQVAPNGPTTKHRFDFRFTAKNWLGRKDQTIIYEHHPYANYEKRSHLEYAEERIELMQNKYGFGHYMHTESIDELSEKLWLLLSGKDQNNAEKKKLFKENFCKIKKEAIEELKEFDNIFRAWL